MLTQMNIEWGYAKTYKTLKALQKKLDEEKNIYPEHNDKFIIVKTPDDRWTAIVQLDMSKGGYIGRYSFLKI